MTRKAAGNEVRWLRSVTQSLAWIARQTRPDLPDLSYRISKIQSTFENAYVRDLRECNRIVEYAASTSTRGIYFLQLFLGMTRSLRRSVMPVSVNNRDNLAGSRRTLNHNKLASQYWRQVPQ